MHGNMVPLTPRWWKSLLIFIGEFLLWPLYFLDELQEKEDTWRQRYGEDARVYWRTTEWVIWVTSIAGLLASAGMVGTGALWVIGLFRPQLIDLQLAQSELAWLTAGLLALSGVLLAVTLTTRLILMFVRGGEEDTPEDAVRDSASTPNPKKGASGAAVAMAACCLLGYYLTWSFYVLAACCATIVVVAVTVMFENRQNRRQRYVPHTGDFPCDENK